MDLHDQQRWNTIGALGNPYVKTPNIDRLVKEGVSFNQSIRSISILYA